MVSIQRRLNSTGRKRIPRERVVVTLKPAIESSSNPQVSATIDLAKLGLQGNARVALEAYFRTSSMRFACGSVDQLTIPDVMELSDIDRGGAIQFRLLVIASDESGRILATADGIRPLQDKTSADREALLPVTETDLHEQLWKIEIDPRAGPRLLLNSRAVGLAARLRSDVLIQGLILPHALRTILREMHADGEEDDDNPWGRDWRAFLKAMDIPEEPEHWADDESRDDWIEEAVEKFCAIRMFAGQYRNLTAESGAD